MTPPKAETSNERSYDGLKWLGVFLLFIAGLAVNYYYGYQPWPLRLLAWLALVGVLAIIALQTSQGKRARVFARESRMELRKVFWPTRQETKQTTLVVAVVVVVLALILWMIDGALMWLIGWLTGQRG